LEETTVLMSRQTPRLNTLITQKREDWETRLSESEAQLERLREDITLLRDELSQEQSQDHLQSDYEILREAVLRYAIACGAVDVQLAMLQARGEGAGPEAADSLHRAMEERTESSNVLRSLARTMQRESKF
jgi:hypothetical protein